MRGFDKNLVKMAIVAIPNRKSLWYSVAVREQNTNCGSSMSGQVSGKLPPFFGAEAIKPKRTPILCFDSRGNGWRGFGEILEASSHLVNPPISVGNGSSQKWTYEGKICWWSTRCPVSSCGRNGIVLSRTSKTLRVPNSNK